MYDKQCKDLAVYFLLDEQPFTPEEVESLSQEIQDAIERWFEPRHTKEEAEHGND